MTRPRATVVGGGLNALGVLRSLAADGIAVDLLVGRNDPGPAAHSRFARVTRYVADAPDAVVDALVAHARRLRRRPCPLILTEEEKVAAVSRARDRLAADYVLMLPPHGVVSTLQDKNGFDARVAEQCEIAPRSLAIRTTDDIARLETLSPPYILKPAGRQPAYLAHHPRAERFGTLTALASALRERLALSNALIVQEWVDGSDETLYFCLQFLPPDGTPPMSFSGQKLRAWPRGTGGTARCTAAPSAIACALTGRTTRFFRQAGVVGLAGMEYKWHSARDDYVMIEPTIGRTDHQAEIATLSGVNLPAAACRWALGHPMPTAANVARAVIWRDPMADANAAAVDSAGIGDVRVPVVDALWRRGDPGPAIVDWRRRIERRVFRRPIP